MNERTKTVIFSHGHESSPAARKIETLRPVAEARGLTTAAPDYRDLRDDPVGRAQRLVSLVDKSEGPVILAGSSLGGWVSMAAAEQRAVAGLFLMAPALFMEHHVPGGVTAERYTPRCRHVAVVHGWHDEIIDWRNSLRYAEAGGHAALHLLDAGHRLERVLDALTGLFSRFLDECPGRKESC